MWTVDISESSLKEKYPNSSMDVEFFSCGDAHGKTIHRRKTTIGLMIWKPPGDDGRDPEDRLRVDTFARGKGAVGGGPLPGDLDGGPWFLKDSMCLPCVSAKVVTPSWERTYALKKALLKIIFLFPRWDMLVFWRVALYDFGGKIMKNWSMVTRRVPWRVVPSLFPVSTREDSKGWGLVTCWVHQTCFTHWVTQKHLGQIFLQTNFRNTRYLKANRHRPWK